MDKKVISSESMYENINVVEQNTKSNLRVATFCVVTSVNKDAKTINAKPLIKEKIEKSVNEYDYVYLPELVNVPYCTGMSKEPEEGDFCICIHLDRSIRGYNEEDLKNNKGKSDGIDKHTLSDCVAIVGFDV